MNPAGSVNKGIADMLNSRLRGKTLSKEQGCLRRYSSVVIVFVFSQLLDLLEYFQV